MNPPRVAFFTDSFHEMNGVAHTSRHYDAFARRRDMPFLNVHAGPQTKLSQDGAVWTLELNRSSVGFRLE
jgi:phosphatidylinositol alpha 1,6-mannosyltransferase